MNDPRSKLIAALDVRDRTAAIEMVDRLCGHVGCFKVGLELFTREGPHLVEEIRDRGEKIFLDLKLHDIPNTVRGAVRSACYLGIHMLTIHASGGNNMLVAALEEARSSLFPPLLLAVTALTSLSPADIAKLGVSDPVGKWVERLAETAFEAGIRGVVASAAELPILQRKFQGQMQFVVPGIRPAGSPSHDQSRAATPRQAINAGADYIVVGRPILNSPDPAAAADEIVEEIRQALESKK